MGSRTLKGPWHLVGGLATLVWSVTSVVQEFVLGCLPSPLHCHPELVRQPAYHKLGGGIGWRKIILPAIIIVDINLLYVTSPIFFLLFPRFSCFCWKKVTLLYFKCTYWSHSLSSSDSFSCVLSSPQILICSFLKSSRCWKKPLHHIQAHIFDILSSSD